jgi:hypothetical protein
MPKHPIKESKEIFRSFLARKKRQSLVASKSS